MVLPVKAFSKTRCSILLGPSCHQSWCLQKEACPQAVVPERDELGDLVYILPWLKMLCISASLTASIHQAGRCQVRTVKAKTSDIISWCNPSEAGAQGDSNSKEKRRQAFTQGSPFEFATLSCSSPVLWGKKNPLSEQIWPCLWLAFSFSWRMIVHVRLIQRLHKLNLN